MRLLYVFYDSRCGLCSTMSQWLRHQRPVCELRMAPKDSAEAARLLGPAAAGEDLIVLSDLGEVWRGNHAWVVVLWALERYRGIANRLASPLLLPLARQAFAALSGNRSRISAWFSLRSDADLAGQLETVDVPGCQRN